MTATLIVSTKADKKFMLKCEETPPEQLLLAIHQFNNREWFDCHETIEELWIGETGEMRDFLQGTLQISVALFHWSNGNHGGAVHLLASGINYLKRVSDICLCVDVQALIADSDRVRVALEELGKDHMESLESTIIPQIKTVLTSRHINTTND